MKKLWTFILSLGIGFSCINANAATSFIEGMEDIPIPEKMMQIQADNFSFGNEETRLVEAYLQTNFGKFSFVVGFYEDTLPQLGWKLKSKQYDSVEFERDGDELTIALVNKMPLIVRVTLTGRQ